MKLKTLLTAVLLASSATLVAGCASNGHERTGGEVFDDVTITAKVKSALVADDDVKAFDIKVETFNGTVQLSGFVDSQYQVNRAGQIAAGVNGVKSVKNDLIHKPN